MMRVKIDVDTKTFIRFLLVVSAFVGTVFLVWKLWPALMIIAISFFLALALNPPVSLIANRLPKHSRVAATALSYLVVLTVLGVFIYIALPPIIDQTNRFIGSLPATVQQVSTKQGVVADIINTYNLQDQLNRLVEGAQQQAGTVAQGIGSSVVNGVTSILTGVVTLVTVLVLTFLMLIEGPEWLKRLWSLYTDPVKLHRHQRIAGRMYKVVSGYVTGQVLVAAIAASLGILTLALLIYFFPSIPSSALIPLAGIIFVTDMIPMIGATLGAMLVFTVLLFNDLGAALIFLLYFIVYQQIENNFIQPVVQSRTVALSAMSIFLAIIIGIALLGIVGGIVAIPVAGCLRILIVDYMERRQEKARAVKRGSGVLAKLRGNAS